MIRTITKRGLHLVGRNFAVIALFFPAAVMAVDIERQDVRDFVDTLATSHGLDRTYLQSVLADGKTIQKILDAISRPAEKTKPWYEYRSIFITEERIEAGVRHFNFGFLSGDPDGLYRQMQLFVKQVMPNFRS